MTTEPERVQVAVPDSVTVQVLRRKLAESRDRESVLEDEIITLMGVVSTLMSERRPVQSPPVGPSAGVSPPVVPDPGTPG